MILWFVLGLLAIGGVGRYASVAGPNGRLVDTCPSAIDLTADARRPTPVIFLHPHCSCSCATLNELTRGLVMVREQPQIIVVVSHPADADGAVWCEGSLWRACTTIGDVQRILDPGGALADAFGATTSGHCIVVGTTGRIGYAGGVTIA